MQKPATILSLICIAAAFAAPSVAAQTQPDEKATEPSCKSQNAVDSNAIGVAMQAFELRMAGKVDQAKELLEKAVAENPEQANAWFELSRVYFYMAPETLNLEPARKAIEKAITINPDNPQYHYWAGQIACYNGILKMHGLLSRLEMPGQMKKAIKYFQHALDLKPDFHKARIELIGMYDRLPWYCGGSKSMAKKHEEMLLKLGGDLGEQPDPDTALLVSGLKHIRKKEYESAEQKIRQYLETNPVIPLRAYGLSQLARIHWLEDRKTGAQEFKKQAEELDKYYWPTLAPPPADLFIAP